jgi:hypothetical protein
VTDFAQYCPSHAYVPGQSPRHSEDQFTPILNAFDPTQPIDTFGDTLAFQLGLYFLDNGFYWECHEMMEPLWMAAPDHSAEKVFFQLMIQIANACLKKRMSRDKAHDRLCAISLDLADDLARRGIHTVYGVEVRFMMKYIT